MSTETDIWSRSVEIVPDDGVADAHADPARTVQLFVRSPRFQMVSVCAVGFAPPCAPVNTKLDGEVTSAMAVSGMERRIHPAIVPIARGLSSDCGRVRMSETLLVVIGFSFLLPSLGGS